MSQPMQTFGIDALRKEYLTKFIDSRKQWQMAVEAETGSEADHYLDMLMWAGLLDLMTRLKNSLKGRTK